MPLSTYCRNCGSAKDPANYADDYCAGCVTAVHEEQQHAAAEGTMTPLEAQRLALSRRAHTAYRNRPDPRFPIMRQDYNDAALRERLAIEPGSEADPRRPGR